MNILFIAGFSLISAHDADSKKLFMHDLGLPLDGSTHNDYLYSENIVGVKHFGIWPLHQAAQACFGNDAWPKDRPVPQASIEFEVASVMAVQEAATELEQKGHALLHQARTEPWGQTVARLQTKEGLIVGVSFAPWLHDKDKSTLV